MTADLEQRLDRIEQALKDLQPLAVLATYWLENSMIPTVTEPEIYEHDRDKLHSMALELDGLSTRLARKFHLCDEPSQRLQGIGHHYHMSIEMLLGPYGFFSSVAATIQAAIDEENKLGLER